MKSSEQCTLDNEPIPYEDLPYEDLPYEDLPSDDLPYEDLPYEDLPYEDLPSEDLPSDEEMDMVGYPATIFIQEGLEPSAQVEYIVRTTEDGRKFIDINGQPCEICCTDGTWLLFKNNSGCNSVPMA